MAYSLAASYVGESLLSGFSWFQGADPSHGYVAYQSRANAEAQGLFSVDENTGVVRLGVDHKNAYGLGEGRPSIRLESKEAYDNGLFIADFLHMAPSQCGMWPAFWTYGANWPAGGEVDIIEGVNTMHQNTISAHTVDGCSLSSSLMAASSGTMVHADCAVGSNNIGCGFAPAANDPSSYGEGFNAVNDGVYAMQRDSKYIKVWHFARGEIPGDIEAKRPDPGLWKLPDAVFGGSSCDVDSFFKGMNLVINIVKLCGDWGNAVWGKSDQCNNFAPTCGEYVANNPQAFANAYWDVKYIDVYRPSDSNPSTRGPSTNATRASSSALDTGVISSNPARVGKYAHLGYFGSGSGFPTFGKAGESGNMTLEMCVDACDGRDKTFAGVFEATCYCAGALDADTRATSAGEGGVCDHACPGDGGEVCGGLMGRGPGAAMNLTTAVATPQRFGNETRSRAPCVPSSVPSRRFFRRDMPRNHLLTMYGVVESNASSSPSLLPPMAPQWNKTFAGAVTQTVFRTVYPLQVVYDTHCATNGAALDPPVAVAADPAVTDPPVAAGGDEASARNGKQGATKTIALQSVPKAGSMGEAAPPAPMTPMTPLPPPASAGILAVDDARLPDPEATPGSTVGSTAQPQGQNSFADVPVVAAAPDTAGGVKAAAALRAAALVVVMVL